MLKKNAGCLWDGILPKLINAVKNAGRLWYGILPKLINAKKECTPSMVRYSATIN